MKKMAWDGTKWGQEDFFPTYPDLVDILGRTDLDFEIFYVFDFLDPKYLDFHVPRFPKSGPGRAGLGPLAGWALGWTGPGVDLGFHCRGSLPPKCVYMQAKGHQCQPVLMHTSAETKSLVEILHFRAPPIGTGKITMRHSS